MSRGLNYNHTFNNHQHGWGTASPEFVQPNPINSYNRIVFEEELPVASYYPERVVFEEHHSVPVHKKHHHGSTEPRKQVHFVEHEEKVSQTFDNFGNKKVYKESVDIEADGFIERKHRNFELNKFGTFNSYY